MDRERSEQIARALGADVVIENVSRPEALGVSEMLAVRGWFDERQCQLREQAAPPCFAEQLRKLTGQLGLDAAALSARFAVSVPSAQRWLDGESEPMAPMRAEVINQLTEEQHGFAR